jgi:cell division protease FtsH
VPPPANGSGPSSPWRRALAAAAWVALFAAMVGIAAFAGRAPGDEVEALSYSALRRRVDAGQVTSVTVGADGGVEGELTGGRSFRSQLPAAAGAELVDELVAAGVDVEAEPEVGTPWWAFLVGLLPYVVIFAALLWFVRRRAGPASGAMGFGRSKAKLIDEQRPATTFGDVAGYEGVKDELSEIVDYLRNPARYHEAGAVGPGGVLMVGPPGTGKTHIARAVAGESDVPFFSVTGSSFVELFVGVGAARVRDLFEQARAKSPAIVFIDEIDAIGGRRGGSQFGSNDEREQTLNQLLSEMDGFDAAEGVVVLAATNRPDVLDPALLRPGRFDRQVVVPLPNQEERRAILAVHGRGKTLRPDVDLAQVARATPGFSGADLKNLMNEAAIVAVRDQRVVIEPADFDAARDRIVLGRRERGTVLLAEERHLVAVHEAGHAVVAAASRHADPVAKVSILPTGAALGMTQQVPLDERHLYTEAHLLDALAVRLAGRAAEGLVAGVRSSGASDDLAQATALATKMVRELGLSDRIGPVSWSEGGDDYLGPRHHRRTCSERTSQAIDEEVTALLRQAEARATELLGRHRPALEALVALLAEAEVVDGSDVYRLLGTSAPDGLGPIEPPESELAGDDVAGPAAVAPAGR